MNRTDTDDGSTLVAYEEGDAFVICDPETPDAWIRAEHPVDPLAIDDDQFSGV